MRNLIAKIMVFCLLIITVHTASGGEHSPIHDPSANTQVQSVLVLQAEDERQPLDDQQINSECSICHAAHILVVFVSADTELNLFAGKQFLADFKGVLTSRNDDITHPPIILI